MTTDLNDLRTAQEHLKHLDSIQNELERTRYMAFILATETSLALEPLLGQLQAAEVALGQAQVEVRRATLLEAAEQVCFMCHENKGDLKVSNGKYYHNQNEDFLKGDWMVPCHANAIRQLMAQQTGQEGQGE